MTQSLLVSGCRVTADTLDRRPIPCSVALPIYVCEGLEAYMLAHKGSTFRTAVMHGLRALGIAINDEDMIPERAMRRSRKRNGKPDNTSETLRLTSIRLPHYVRARAEHYLLGHPQMRFRHLVMAALKELGIEVQDGDLVAERRNVLAAASARPEGQ